MLALLRERRAHQAVVEEAGSRARPHHDPGCARRAARRSTSVIPGKGLRWAALKFCSSASSLVLVNGIFVAAEFALLASADVRPSNGAQRLVIGSRERFWAFSSRRPRQDRYIATAQLGITLASLGLGMSGEHRLSRVARADHWTVPAIGGAALAATIST